MELTDMVSYVRGIGTGVVSTLATDGSPQAAYLDLTATDRGELVFNARSDSRGMVVSHDIDLAGCSRRRSTAAD